MLGPRFDPVLRGGEFDPIRRENSFTAIYTLFKLNTNRVMWAPKFQNAVYAIDSTGRVTKEIALDLGDKEMPGEFYEQEYPKFRKHSREHNKSSFSGDFVENTGTQST